ncbi:MULTISPECIES: MFS transporter [unclassified Microbacterium]|uniref:MFS transporter n=1 Tax=unclassified Microbacterium TaxID=2609290 RepID=UPI0012F89A3E|nr:MFS transporter [Microbacterium sp. MAH-37]MVQ41014.1 MFS transporter [Microbacterium sp. MAH-37]
MTTPSTPAATTQRVAAVVGFLVFVELTSGFIQGYYLPLFGKIAEHLGVSDADITWFNTVQTLAAAVCVPILSRLGDIFGHRLMLRIGIVLVLAGTLLTALAPNLPVMLAARLLIGPLAVWLPLEIGIVHSRVQGQSGRRAVGMLVSALTIGAVAGSIIGGFVGAAMPIVPALLVPAAVVLVCAIIVFTVVPESTTRTLSKIDWLGFALLAVGMLAILFGLRSAQGAGFGNLTTIATLVVAAAIVVGFILWELRVASPAINVRVVASRALWPVYATSFLFGMSLFGTQTVMTTFYAADPDEVGYGFALSSGVIGLLTAASALVAAIGAALFATIAARTTMRGVLMLGVGLAALANVLLAIGHASLPTVIATVALSGFGGGLLLGALPALVAELSPATETGIATGLYNTLKTLGGSVAGAVFAVVLSAFALPGALASSIGGYVTVWLICAAAFALAFVLLLLVRVRGTQTTALHTVATEAA